MFTEGGGGVAAIVCDTTGNTVRQGYCYTCLAIGGGFFGRVTKSVSSSLVGSLAKGFFAEVLRKVCGNLRETRSYSVRKGCGNSAESLRKFRGKLQTNFCNDPFPNHPISELLSQGNLRSITIIYDNFATCMSLHFHRKNW